MIGGGGSQIYPLIRCWPYFKRRGRFVTRKSETIMPGKLRGKGAFINVSAVRWKEKQKKKQKEKIDE